jgi:allophanate hydrolase subunit 2
LRFAGEPPVRQTSGEILSRGVPVGAVEVPAGTEVLVLHRGRGVTAGYPVLGVVTGAGLDALAQVRPGDEVRFRHCTLQQAVARTRSRRAASDALARRVATAFDGLGLFDLATGDDRWSTPVLQRL